MEGSTENKTEKEVERILAAAEAVGTINVSEAIEYCGTPNAFVKALRTFYWTLDDKAAEVEQAYQDENHELYTIKMHALKSTARVLGMEELSAFAKRLEQGGKEKDSAFITANAPELMSQYRFYKNALAFLDDATEDDPRPFADAGTIADAYVAIADVAVMMDYDSVEMVIEAMSEYRLPEADTKRFSAIEKALKELNWEEIRALTAEV